MRSLYYRCCWHRVSNLLFIRYRQNSSLIKAVYNPKAFIPHAASLRQGFPHCAIFPTAASRRSWARVPVPMWLIILIRPATRHSLGGQLPRQLADRPQAIFQAERYCYRPLILRSHPGLAHLSVGYPKLGECTCVLLTRSPWV